MQAEADTPLADRWLMIVGKLSDAMIREMEQRRMPRRRKRCDSCALDVREHFRNRDRAKDWALYTLYAYADIPLGRRYNCLFHVGDRVDRCTDPVPIDCSIEHAVLVIGGAMIPVPQLEHGHKHILFLSVRDSIPSCIPEFERWDDMGEADCLFGLGDRTVFKARQAKGE